MLESMTGYGKAICELKSKMISIEIKSLNSKQLEINTRLPILYKEKDIEIRNMVSDKLIRGKVDIYVTYEVLDTTDVSKLNEDIIKNYVKQLENIATDLNIKNRDNIIEMAMRLPDTVSVAKEELDVEEWNCVKQTINEAIDKLCQFRSEEGITLNDDIQDRIKQILQYLDDIKTFEEKRIDSIKSRIEKSLYEFNDIEKVNSDRFEQELIYYLEKLDITEEKVRLKSHCDYFLETMKEEGPKGKKLNFISQEIGREINTIGSKANDADIQKIVVQMKNELEKIKEQLMNIL